MDALSSSLLLWIKTFDVVGVNASIEELTDGVAISKVLYNIDSSFFNESWLSKIKVDVGNNWRLKVSNLKKILQGIVDYYNETLGQQITDFIMPDVTEIGEKNDVHQLGRLLQLVLGCAVNCEHKHQYIEALMGLEEDVQHVLMNAIQELMTKETPGPQSYADFDKQLKGLTEDLNSTKESKEQITQRCHELDMQVVVLLEEKANLLSENEKLLERLNNPSFEDTNTLAGKRFLQLTQKLELLQDEFFKLETGRDELKSKVKSQEKEISDLQQKNEDLHRLAEESQSLRDELDMLKEHSNKLRIYETTIETYKKKLEDMSDLKRQVKLLEDKNTQYMQQCIELEDELKKTTIIKTQIDSYKSQVQQLQTHLSAETKRADKGEFENKRHIEKLASATQERDRLVLECNSLKESLDELRCMQLQKEITDDGSGNDVSISDSDMLGVIPPEIREKLIRLEHENKILKINAGTAVDKQLTVVQSLLDDKEARINELETDIRLANRRIMELESQVEDIHASNQGDAELKHKMSDAIRRQKDTELEKCHVQIESLECQLEASVLSNQHMQEALNQKDEEMQAMENRYRRYLDKAKNVIKTMDNKKNTCSPADVVNLKAQLSEKERIIVNLEKEAGKARVIQDMEDKIITTAFYNLGAQLHKRVSEERLVQSNFNQTFLARQRQVTSRKSTPASRFEH